MPASSKKRTIEKKKQEKKYEMKIEVLIDNQANEPFLSEHGLSLLFHFEKEKILFDTGAGKVLKENFSTAKVDCKEISTLILSHGHYDHTGGVMELYSAGFAGKVFYGKGMDIKRYSIHPDKPVKELTIPENSLALLKNLPPEQKNTVEDFIQIHKEIFLAGGIVHSSFEDRGGPFFLDKEGKIKDEIRDEISLLTSGGVLVPGCCHAGIINTLEYCRKNAPHIPVRYIMGGLHLLYADEEKLAKTVQYLQNVKSLEKIILLHCTGENAVQYLKEHLSCEVVTGKAGDVFIF